MRTVSVDIGSTWTKAALFGREGDTLTLINHVITPTTPHHLAEVFSLALISYLTFVMPVRYFIAVKLT